MIRDPLIRQAIKVARRYVDDRNRRRPPGELAEVDQTRAGVLDHFVEADLDNPSERRGVIVGLALASIAVSTSAERAGLPPAGLGPVLATLDAVARLDEEKSTSAGPDRPGPRPEEVL